MKRKTIISILSIIALISIAGTGLTTNATNTNCNHSYSSNVVTSAPTCTSAGISQKTCTLCGNVKTEKTKATGHKTKKINKKSSTYISKGYTGDTYCTRCKKIIFKGKNIKKLTLKKPSVTIKGKTKSIAVTYRKVKNADGFQVKYTRNGKTIKRTYRSSKSTTKSITGLSAGKYRVSVRAFVIQNDKKAFSKWTKERKVTVKNPAKKKTSSQSSSGNTSSGGSQYWVSSGAVYHSTRACPTLSRSRFVMSGTAPSGRRPCKVCH